jgi:hypothetical protein
MECYRLIRRMQKAVASKVGLNIEFRIMTLSDYTVPTAISHLRIGCEGRVVAVVLMGSAVEG